MPPKEFRSFPAFIRTYSLMLVIYVVLIYYFATDVSYDVLYNVICVAMVSLVSVAEFVTCTRFFYKKTIFCLSLNFLSIMLEITLRFS